MSEVWDAIDANQNDTDHLRAALAEAESRIEALETALAAVVRALAYGETARPYQRPMPRRAEHQHALCGTQTTQQHLSHAAEALGIDVGLDR